MYHPSTRSLAQGGFSDKCETGFHAGIVEETADRDATPHLGPAIPLDQFFDDGFQCYPMQRIEGMGRIHDRTVNRIEINAEVESL